MLFAQLPISTDTVFDLYVFVLADVTTPNELQTSSYTDESFNVNLNNQLYGYILSAYLLHAALYVSTLPLGTYIGQSFVLSNASVPNVGGVSDLISITVSPLQFVKA